MIVTFVFKYLLPFQVSMPKTFKFSHPELVWLLLVDAFTSIWGHKLANLIRYGQNFTQKQRAEMFDLCFTLNSLAALDLGFVLFPQCPSPAHRAGTGSLAPSNRLPMWASRVEVHQSRRTHRCLLVKQNSSSNLRLYHITWLIWCDGLSQRLPHLPVGLFSLCFFVISLFFLTSEYFVSQKCSIGTHHSSIGRCTYNERWIMSYKRPLRRSSVRVLESPAGVFLVPGVLAS